MIQIKQKVKELKKQGFYDNWTKRNFGPITFFIYPNFTRNFLFNEDFIQIMKEITKLS